MSRLFITLSALGLISASVGCTHTAGICDCYPFAYGCGGCCGNTGVSPTQYGCCGHGHGVVLAGPNGIKAAEPIAPPKEKAKDVDADKGKGEPPMEKLDGPGM